MEIRCIIEVVSLIRIIQFVKGPEMGTVHDNDHTIVDCPITSLFFFPFVDCFPERVGSFGA